MLWINVKVYIMYFRMEQLLTLTHSSCHEVIILRQKQLITLVMLLTLLTLKTSNTVAASV